MIETSTVIIIILSITCVLLWAYCNVLKDEVFKWRKRWIIERFGVGVEGQGNLFVVSQYYTGVKCLIFAKREKALAGMGMVRDWKYCRSRVHNFGENHDMPDEEEIGLPRDSNRDYRHWVSAGFGLCLLPQSLHEAGTKKSQRAV